MGYTLASITMLKSEQLRLSSITTSSAAVNSSANASVKVLQLYNSKIKTKILPDKIQLIETSMQTRLHLPAGTQPLCHRS